MRTSIASFRSPRSPRSAARLVLPVFPALAVACSGGGADSTGPAPGSGTPSSGDISGTFELATVNGNPLSTPVWVDNTVDEFSATMYLTSGSIVLRPDSTYTQIIHGRLVISGVSDISNMRTTSGTYSFAPSEPGANNGTLTMHANGAQQTLQLTQISITQQTTIPGAAGQPDVPMTLVYVRP
jgi:hypothetical protein